jgi:hypothetical protein
MGKRISTNKALDIFIEHGHKLSSDELFEALDSLSKIEARNTKIMREAYLKNPHPKDIAMAKSRRARGMDYDKELLGDD